MKEVLKCTSGYNLSRVEGNKQMRVICAWQEPFRKRIFENLLHSVGGEASHGICEAHYQETLSGTRSGIENLVNDLEETKEMEVDPDGGPRRWRLGDLKTA